MKRLFLLFLFIFSSELQSQSIALFDIDSAYFPVIKAKFYVNPQANYTIDDVKIMENGIQRKILKIDCPTPKKAKTTSVVISCDVSASIHWINTMKYYVAFNDKYISSYIFNPSEFSLQMCDDTPVLLTDFVKNRDKAYLAARGLQEGDNNDFYEQLLNSPNGALRIASYGLEKRYVILLTDGAWYPMPKAEIDECIDVCRRLGITFYAGVLYDNIEYKGLISESLDEIAKATGGKLYMGYGSKEKAEELAFKIQGEIQGVKPCEIEWLSGEDCTQRREVTIEVVGKNLKTNTWFTAPKTLAPEIITNPVTLSFYNIAPPQIQEKEVIITAQNLRVQVNKIKLSNNNFEIVSGNAPFALNAGESHKMIVRFIPKDSSYTTCRFELESNACQKPQFYTVGGFRGVRPVKPDLKIVFPNGGEKLGVGEIRDIKWSGIPIEDSIGLEFSIDSGKNWNSITKGINGESYSWLVPNSPSNKCIAKAYQLLKEEDKTKSIFPFSSNLLRYSPDGNRLLGTDSGRAFIYDLNTLTKKLIMPFDEAYQHDSGELPYIEDALITNDGNYIVVASRNGWGRRVEIRSAKSGGLIKYWYYPTRGGYTREPDTADFTAEKLYNIGDSVFAVGVNNYGSIGVWNVFTGRTISKIKTNNFNNNFILSPNGLLLCLFNEGINGTNETLIMFDVRKMDTLYTKISSKWEGHRPLAFSPDSKKILSMNSNNLFMADVINFNITAQTKKLSNGIIKANFSPDGAIIAVSEGEFYSRTIPTLYNPNDLSYLNKSVMKTFGVWHETSIYDVQFSPDSKWLAGFDSDSRLNLWNLDDTPIQYDLSDSLWSIVTPTAVTIQDIDMGKVLIGSKKDSLVTAFIQNNSGVIVKINSVSISGSNPSEFLAVTAKEGFELGVNETRSIEFRFSPTTQGLRSAQINFTMQSGVLSTHIYGEGVAPVISIPTKVIDFGAVELYDKKDTTIVTSIKNIGTAPLVINSLTNNGIDNVQFKLISDSTEFILSPNEMKTLQLRFSPVSIGRTNGAISINYLGIGSPAKIYLYGQGLGGTVSTPHDSGAPNDKKYIPLLLKGARNYLIKNGKTKFRAELSYDNSVLFASEFSATKLDIGLRKITIEKQWDGLSDTLAKIPITVCLGNKDFTEIKIEKFNWLDANSTPINYEVPTYNGSFKVLNICASGGTRRFISNNGNLFLKVIESGIDNKKINIEFGIIEDGRTKIYLTNSIGEMVSIVLDEELKNGTYNLSDILPKGLSSGFYNCILQTANHLLNCKIIIR